MKVAWVILAIAAAIGIGSATYTVDEAEQVIITEFGKVKGHPIGKPGLKLKLPMVQQVVRFPRRWLEWDGAQNQLPTKDKKYIYIDTTARWRIADPIKFFQSVRDEMAAQSRLDDVIDGATRDVVAGHDLYEVVRASARALEVEEARETPERAAEIMRAVEVGREGIVKKILAKASKAVPEYGIELVDVRIQRVIYVESVQQKVFDRMIAERKQIAERHRSEGLGKSAEIRGQMERELKEITSEAYRKAQEIKGKADAEATRVYAEAYNRDPDFYRFTKSLEALESAVDAGTVVLLSTDGDLFEFLKKAQP